MPDDVLLDEVSPTVEAEADVSSSAPRRGGLLRRWLVPEREGLARRLAYALLGLPLGLAYAGLFAGLVAATLLVVYGVGLLLVLVVLAAARACSAGERRLAGRLADVEVPPGPALRREQGWARRVRLLVTSGSTWRGLAWLGVRVLVATSLAAMLVVGGAGVVVTIGYPYSFDLPHHLLLDVVAALVAGTGLLVMVRVLELSTRALAGVAPTLLGAGAEERIAALRRASIRAAGRTTVARDLHDTIGHALTASLLQAEAAERALRPGPAEPGVPRDLDFARQALGHIEENTRQALAELDRALAVLGDPSRARQADERPPDLEDLDGLLAGLRDGGLPVALTVDTDPGHVVEEVSRAAYRVVQEGLTNVLRHAGLRPTAVHVTDVEGRLCVVVRNEPGHRGSALPGRNGGHGVAGLRERVEELGGSLRAGASDDAGFELAATWPRGWRRR